MREIELKFEVDDGFDASILSSTGTYVIDELPRQTLAASYYDTADLKLARWGATLRFRKGDDDGDLWTLKLPVDGAREELKFEGGPGHVPDEAKALVTALIRSDGLKLVARLRTKRSRWAVRVASAEPQLAEVALDEVSVLKDRRIVERFRELEIEAVETDGVGLAQIANVMRQNGARDRDQTPKVIRALGEAALASPDVAEWPAVGPQDPARDAIRAALAANVTRLIQHDPLARLGHAEGLHQMRVACRRTRSDLRTFEPLVDLEWAEALIKDLKWTGNVLGAVRDLDVMIERLQEASGGLDQTLVPLFEVLEQRRTSARAEAGSALRSKRYVDMVERLVDAAREPRTTRKAEQACEKVLLPLVSSRWRKLAGAAQMAGPDASDEVLHDVRIRAKKVRYAAEAVAASMGKKTRKDLLSFAEKVAGLQEVLGTHQDATVAMGTIRDAARDRMEDGDFVFAAGRLFEREARVAANARKDMKTTWGKIDRKKNLGWLTT